MVRPSRQPCCRLVIVPWHRITPPCNLFCGESCCRTRLREIQRQQVLQGASDRLANARKMSAALDLLLVQIKGTIDFNLQCVNALAGFAIEMNGMTAGIRRVANDRKSLVGESAFGCEGYLAGRG